MFHQWLAIIMPSRSLEQDTIRNNLLVKVLYAGPLVTAWPSHGMMIGPIKSMIYIICISQNINDQNKQTGCKIGAEEKFQLFCIIKHLNLCNILILNLQKSSLTKQTKFWGKNYKIILYCMRLNFLLI